MNEDKINASSSEAQHVSGREVKELNKEIFSYSNQENVFQRNNEHYTYSSQIALQSYISPLTNPSRDEDLSSLERRLDEALERLVLGASTLEEAVERIREARTTMDFSQSIATHSASEIPFSKTPVSSAVSEAIGEGANEADTQRYDERHPNTALSSSSYPYNVVYTPRQEVTPPPAIGTTSSNSQVTQDSPLTRNTSTESSMESSPHHLERESSLRESLGESHAEELLASSSNEEANLTSAIVDAIEEGFEKVADAQGQDGGQTSSGNSPTSDALPSSGLNIEALARNVLSGNGSTVLGSAVSGGAARLLSSAATAVPAGLVGFAKGGIKGGLFAGAGAVATREAYGSLAEEQATAETFGSNFYEMRANTSAMRQAGMLAGDAQSSFERVSLAKAGMAVGDFSSASQIVVGGRDVYDYSDIERYGDNPAEFLAVGVERMKAQGLSEDEIVGRSQLMGFSGLPSMAEGWTEGTREQIAQKVTQAQGRDEQAEQAGSTASALVENTDAVRIAKDAMLDVAARSSELVDPINGLIESNDSVAKNLDDLNQNLSSFVDDTLSTFNEVKADVQTGIDGVVSSVEETYEHGKGFVLGSYQEGKDAALDVYKESKDALSSSFNDGKEWVESNLISPIGSALDVMAPTPASELELMERTSSSSYMSYPASVPQSSLSLPTSPYPLRDSNSSLLSAVHQLTEAVKSSNGGRIVIENNSDAEVIHNMQGDGIASSGF